MSESDVLRHACQSSVQMSAGGLQLNSANKKNLPTSCNIFCGTMITQLQDVSAESPLGVLSALGLSALVLAECPSACMDSAALNPSDSNDVFTSDFCKRLIYTGTTEDWCDAHTGNGPGGFVVFRPSNDDASQQVSLPCDGDPHLIQFKGETDGAINWQCSGGGGWQRTQKNLGEQHGNIGDFVVTLTQEQKPVTGEPACRLRWHFK